MQASQHQAAQCCTSVEYLRDPDSLQRLESHGSLNLHKNHQGHSEYTLFLRAFLKNANQIVVSPTRKGVLPLRK